MTRIGASCEQTRNGVLFVVDLNNRRFSSHHSLVSLSTSRWRGTDERVVAREILSSFHWPTLACMKGTSRPDVCAPCPVLGISVQSKIAPFRTFASNESELQSTYKYCLFGLGRLYCSPSAVVTVHSADSRIARSPCKQCRSALGVRSTD